VIQLLASPGSRTDADTVEPGKLNEQVVANQLSLARITPDITSTLACRRGSTRAPMGSIADAIAQTFVYATNRQIGVSVDICIAETYCLM
jgi:hypothetical protein